MGMVLTIRQNIRERVPLYSGIGFSKAIDAVRNSNSVRPQRPTLGLGFWRHANSFVRFFNSKFRRLVHSFAAQRSEQRFDRVNLVVGNVEVVLIQDDEIGELAGFQ